MDEIVGLFDSLATAVLGGDGAPDARGRILSLLREALEADAVSLFVVESNQIAARATCRLNCQDESPDESIIADIAVGKRKRAPAGVTVFQRAMGGRTITLAVSTARAPVPDQVLEHALLYCGLLTENHTLSSALSESNDAANRRMEEIAALYEISSASGTIDVHPLLNIILAKAASVMGAQACSLMLRDERDDSLVIEAAYGLSDDIIKGTRIGMGEGLAGRVAATAQPVLVGDVAADPRFRERVRARKGISSSMLVPLFDENRGVTGVLSIRRHHPSAPFTEDDLRLFCVFATHASLAVSNARLYQQLNVKIQEMTTISDVMRAISSSLDLDHVLSQIVGGIVDVVGFDRCCVYLLDTNTNEFVAGARMGYADGQSVRERLKHDEGIVGLAAREQTPIFSHDATGLSANGSTEEVLAAPIVVRRECIGVVLVDNSRSQGGIGHDDVEMLATFVSQAGIAIENARLYKSLEQQLAELNVIYEHSRSISVAYGLENAGTMLVRAACEAVQCKGVALLLMDTTRNRLRLVGSSGDMKRRAPWVEAAVQRDACVEFVRRQSAPLVLAPGSKERLSGPYADALTALAPARSNMLLAPLISEESTIGALVLFRETRKKFVASEVKLMSIITSHASIVLKNAMVYDQHMRQKVLELSALYEFSQRISSAGKIDDALASILGIVADLADFDASHIYLIDTDSAVARVGASRFRGDDGTVPEDESLYGAGVISWSIRERKALVFPDVSREPRFASAAEGHTRSLMCIPLVVRDDVIGVLSVHSNSPNKYSEEDVRVLSIIASQGAAIFSELKALDALMSYTDNILSSIAVGVATINRDGKVLTWNQAAERISGVPADRIVGLKKEWALWMLPVGHEDANVIRRALTRVLETGETYQAHKLRLSSADRDDMYINLNISKLLDKAGDELGLVVIFEDVTSEIRMEEEFTRIRELASIGQLAATIAHELRNPLSSIKGSAQFLQNEYSEIEPVREFLGIIIDEVNGLNSLTTEFLEFARPMMLELKPVSVNEIVSRALNVMRHLLIDSDISVDDSLDDRTPIIQADERQLERVTRNVILNAVQAMPDGGAISIRTGPTPGNGAFVEIEDTGVGIGVDELDRIFQPFFTTKTKGTGLGLSVVSKIVENHGGRVEVRSVVGKGTTFRFTLPRVPERSAIAEEVDHTLERRISRGPRGLP